MSSGAQAASGAPATNQAPAASELPVALVIAIADNGVIGNRGALPWHLPDDLKHFKAVTLGKPVLMGRRTFEAIGRALPGRRNFVLSRASEDTDASGVEYVTNLAQARARATGAPELCVIGGAQVYALAMPLASRIYLTRVHAAVAGDTYFLPLAAEGNLDAAEGGSGAAAGRSGNGASGRASSWRRQWREVERIEHPADERHAHAMSFLRLERR